MKSSTQKLLRKYIRSGCYLLRKYSRYHHLDLPEGAISEFSDSELTARAAWVTECLAHLNTCGLAAVGQGDAEGALIVKSVGRLAKGYAAGNIPRF